MASRSYSTANSSPWLLGISTAFEYNNGAWAPASRGLTSVNLEFVLQALRRAQAYYSIMAQMKPKRCYDDIVFEIKAIQQVGIWRRFSCNGNFRISFRGNLKSEHVSGSVACLSFVGRSGTNLRSIQGHQDSPNHPHEERNRTCSTTRNFCPTPPRLVELPILQAWRQDHREMLPTLGR